MLSGLYITVYDDTVNDNDYFFTPCTMCTSDGVSEIIPQSNFSVIVT